MISYDLIKDVFDLDNPLTLEYFELCSVAYEGKGEKHHILPQSICPEYSKDSWNIVNLSYQNHYRVHEILPQVCLRIGDYKKMLFAWRLLSNTRDEILLDSVTYSRLKEGLRTANSSSNSALWGVKLSKERCLKISEGQKGENHWMFGKGKDAHPFYGRCHSEESKQLMSITTKPD